VSTSMTPQELFNKSKPQVQAQKNPE